MAGEPESVVGQRHGAASGSCTIEARRDGDLTIVAVRGTLDVLSAPEFEARIGDAAAGSPRCVVVDLTDVDFLGSSGMGVLVKAHTDLGPAIRVVIVAEGPATSRPLRLIGIADIIDIHPTLDAALDGLST